jgi:hypothetical protein
MSVWASAVGKGDLVGTVAGTLSVDLTDLVAGEKAVYTVDHGDTALEEDAALYGRFALAEMPRFVGTADIIVVPLADGLTGEGFKVAVEVVSAPADPTFDIAWTRVGLLAADAAG